MAKQLTLWAMLVLLVAITKDSPQGLIYPMALLVYLLSGPIKVVLTGFPRSAAFILSGTTLGLMTEAFAIASNWDLPAAEKVLLHPSAAIDLLFGLFYYTMYMSTWYLLLRKIALSKTTVYISSAFFGALVEQGGGHIWNTVANPFWGIPMLLIITSVYGIFPVLAYYLTETRFVDRTTQRWVHFPVIAASLFFFWAIYGNFVHVALLDQFPKE